MSENTLAQFKLTPRELEVLHLIADGFTNQNICAKLGIKRDTFSRHQQNIFEKTGLLNKVELAKLVMGSYDRAVKSLEQITMLASEHSTPVAWQPASTLPIAGETLRLLVRIPERDGFFELIGRHNGKQFVVALGPNWEPLIAICVMWAKAPAPVMQSPKQARFRLVPEEHRQTIINTLARCKGNRAKTAAELGVNRSTLYVWLRQIGVLTSMDTTSELISERVM